MAAPPTTATLPLPDDHENLEQSRPRPWTSIGSTAGIYTFRNNAAASGSALTFNGTVTSQAASTRPVALTLEGTNTGLNEITNTLGHGPGQRIDPINSGSVVINAGTLVVKNGNALSNNSLANGIGVFINAGTLL